jgi:membrane protein implicated in regulation of membrane protease activity
MDRKMLSGRVILKYILFQLPSLCVFILVLLFLRRWIDIPSWVILLLAFIWAGKDAVMYPLVWRAYDDSTRDHMLSLVGRPGTAQERLSPSGYVSVNGELWKAEPEQPGHPVEKGTRIRVTGFRGMTLMVTVIGNDEP